MTGTRNPSRKYFKRNQPYFYKSVDNWEEWDTDESYDRTFFIGVDDSDPEDIDVALYMIWGGKPVAVVGDKVLYTISGVVETAEQLETEIQSILEEVQELATAVAQSEIDIEEAVAAMNELVDRCEGILDGAEAARDLAKEWATKMDGMVEEEGEPVDYSAKYYANEAKESEMAAASSASSASDDADLAEAWATKTNGTVDGSEYSSKYYAGQSADSATTAGTKAGEASASATLASKWATQLTTPVEGGEYSAKQYAQNAGTSAGTAASYASEAHIDAGAASGSATAAVNSATLAQEWATKMDGQVASTDYSSKYYAGQAAGSATAAQEALDNVHGLIATPIGTIFQSIYVDESMDIARQLNGQLISSIKFTGFRDWLDIVQTAIPNLFTDEANWQAEKALSKFGQCGKFVIDDENQTIRLPAVVNAQGLLGLSGIGNLVSESLPNISGSWAGIYNSNGLSGAVSGTFKNDGSGPRTNFAVDSAPESAVFDIDASRSSSAYQNGAPVQQEAVQYPYYIQVATGVEETLPAIREYKVNNSDYFGKSMYSDVAPDNASWLASNGTYNARAVYPDYYDWLLEKRNNRFTTFYGLNNASSGKLEALIPSSSVAVNDLVYTRLNSTAAIVLGYVTAISGTQISYHNNANGATGTLVLDASHTESLYKYSNITPNILLQEEASKWPSLLPNTTDYDFVINTSDQTFRLPLLNGEEDLPGNAFGSMTYNGHGSDYTATKNGHFSLYGYGSTAYIWLHNLTSSDYSDCSGSTDQNSPCGVSVKCKKGDTIQAGYYGGTITLFGFTPAVGNGTLYYYVGDTVQDASLINAGAVLGQLANKADINASNFNADGKSLLSGLASPSSNFEAWTLGASGASYLAPANGHVVIRKISGVANAYLLLRTNRQLCNGGAVGTGTATQISASVKVSKGDTVYVDYSANGNTVLFGFVYDKGEV